MEGIDELIRPNSETEEIQGSTIEKEGTAKIAQTKEIIESFLGFGVLAGGIIGLQAMQKSLSTTTESVAHSAVVAEYGKHNSAKLDSVKNMYGERIFVYWATQQKETIEKPKSTGPIEYSISPDSISKVESEDGTFTKSMLEFRLFKSLPSFWMDNVSSIRQTERKEESSADYGLGKGWSVLGQAQRTETGLTKIVLTGETKGRSAYENARTIFHEVAHANDWERSRHLSTEERVDLLLAVSLRLSAEDRYLSEYVETISNKDKQKEAYIKAVEYWAEISSVYFSGSGALSEADAKIVSRYSHEKLNVAKR